MIAQSFGIAAARPIQSGIVGIERRISIDPLDDRVDQPAVEAGDAAEHDAEDQAERHADQADRQRDARART